MITLTPVPTERLDQLSGLRQLPGQYANDGAQMILDRTRDLSFHAIHKDAQLVGMFKLDPHTTPSVTTSPCPTTWASAVC